MMDDAAKSTEQETQAREDAFATKAIWQALEARFAAYAQLIDGLARGEVGEVVLYDARIAISDVPPKLVARFIQVVKAHGGRIHESKPGGRVYQLSVDEDELAFRRLADETW